MNILLVVLLVIILSVMVFGFIKLANLYQESIQANEKEDAGDGCFSMLAGEIANNEILRTEVDKVNRVCDTYQQKLDQATTDIVRWKRFEKISKEYADKANRLERVIEDKDRRILTLKDSIEKNKNEFGKSYASLGTEKKNIETALAEAKKELSEARRELSQLPQVTDSALSSFKEQVKELKWPVSRGTIISILESVRSPKDQDEIEPK